MYRSVASTYTLKNSTATIVSFLSELSTKVGTIPLPSSSFNIL